MALFKSRKSAEEPVAAAAQPETVEAMRRRARHRLIGASVLVLAGVIGFPLLFDTQPRPIPVDIPIEIPDRNKVKPLPAPVAAHAPAAPGPVAVASAARTEERTQQPPAGEPAKVEATPETKPEIVAKAEPKAEPKNEPKAEAKDDGARAKALLEGKSPETVAAGEGRFIVQVGAFSDAAKARETRMKVERAGMKTYTHVAETKEGKLIRVRVGPFANRADADKAAEKIKGLDLQAKILTL